MNTIQSMNLLLTGEEGMSRLFDLDIQLLHDSVLTLVAVFVLFLAGSYFFFNPARKFLEKRKQGIADDIQSAKSEREEAERLKKEYEEKLSGVDSQVEQILSDARKKALSNENKIIVEAKEEAERILERANQEAKLEKQRVAHEVKTEMVSAATVMAGKIVATSIDDATQERLLDETLKEMGENTWLS